MLILAMVILITACDKEEIETPSIQNYKDVQGDNQSGYFLEPLDNPISITISNPNIHIVEYYITKGGGEILQEEHVKGEMYHSACSDSNSFVSTVFEINSFNEQVVLCNKWLLGCETENELTIFLIDTNFTSPVDTIIYTATATKRDDWNRSCRLDIFTSTFDLPPDFKFDGGILDIHPNGDIWVLNSYPVYKSTDDGKSFEKIYSDVLEENRYSIDDAAISPSGRIFFGTRNNGIIISEDNGLTWAYSNSGLSSKYYIRRFEFLNDTEYVCNSAANGIFYTSNEGDSWKKLDVSYGSYEIDEYLSAVKIENTILMIDEWRHLIKSEDNGETWDLIRDYIPDYNNLRKLVTYNNVVYAKTESGGTYSIFKSVDKGETWVKLVDNKCYNEVNFKNQLNLEGLFYYVDMPCNPLYDAEKIYYIDINGQKGTLINNIPDIGFNDFIVLPNGNMILSPSQKGGIFYNDL